MRKTLIKITAFVLFVLSIFLMPLLVENGNDIFYIEMAKNSDFAIVFAIYTAFFVLEIVCMFVWLFEKKTSRLMGAISLLFFISGVFYLIAVFTLKNISTISIAKGSIFLSFISFGFFIAASSNVLKRTVLTTKDIIEIGLFVAMALILNISFFKFKVVPNGGSISFAMIPLVIIALRKDLTKSFIAIGVVYGLIDCLLDGYGIITYPLDYFLAFGSLSVISLFRKWVFIETNKRFSWKGFLILTASILLALILRTLFSTISGMLLYGLKFVPSLIYQLTYIGPSGGLLIAISIVLYPTLVYLNKRYNNR